METGVGQMNPRSSFGIEFDAENSDYYDVEASEAEAEGAGELEASYD